MNIPGYIDLQVNGIKGVDYSSPDLTEDAFVFSCRELWNNQTVGFLPTIITSPDALVERNLKLMTAALRHVEVSRCVLGFHLEGPFISAEDGARGAHNRAWVRDPDASWLNRVQEWSGGRIKMVTMAAEKPGSADFIRAACSMGIVISLGHQLAGPDTIQAAVEAGATALTHVGNGLPKMIHRFDNPLWPSLAEDALTALVITDGHHVPKSMIKTIFRAKGVDKFIVTSDASPLALMPPGRYSALGNPVVIEENGRLYNPETGYLVGSWATMRECAAYLKTLDLLSAAELDQVTYHNPLRLITTAS